MHVADIIERIVSGFEGLVPKSSWGETSLFYNPGKLLPNGVYFCTTKEQNGENDKASDLSREGIFRLSFGLPKATYEELFGSRPKRPIKGGIIDTGHDFAALNKLMPHPIYGWMSWVQVLNPSKSTFESILPLIAEAHSNAVIKFKKKLKIAAPDSPPLAR
ncbi:MAG: hypothetical protein EA403_17320 [Spirochaetaceae bacterium]|nr:MAG: hypothetical protein EA403_17320 [Spirochaetaceae bacterium]